MRSLAAPSRAPPRRAFGRGVFSMFHGVIVTAAPALAGGLFDHTGDPFTALLFAADRPAACCTAA